MDGWHLRREEGLCARKQCGDTRLLLGRAGGLERDLLKVIRTEVKAVAVILQGRPARLFCPDPVKSEHWGDFGDVRQYSLEIAEMAETVDTADTAEKLRQLKQPRQPRQLRQPRQ